MPRARSGSFYCPLEDAASPLSLSQKAAISTAHPIHSSFSSSLPSTSQAQPHPRRHARAPSFDGAVCLSAPTSVTLPPAKLQSDISRSQSYSHSSLPKRHSWSPRRPSPLRRQVDAPRPMCPSALWKHSDTLLPSSNTLLPIVPSAQRKSRPLRQSVLKNAFLSSPMGEKACMYGLRVAWCVWGDVKDILAKEIYRPSPRRTNSTDEEPEHREHANVDVDALSPPPLSSVRRSSLKRENSFVWEEQAPVVTSSELEPLAIFDFEPSSCQELEDDSSESEYSDDEEEEGDTESDELDLSDIELGLEDEEEVEREFGLVLREKSVQVHDRWEVLSLRI